MAAVAPSETGFSLIEALVALLILAVASVGLIGATEAHIDSIGGIERRVVAQWVAENALTTLSLPGAGVPVGRVRMLDRDWQVAVQRQPTADPDIQAVTVAVGTAGSASPDVRLRGFVDEGAGR